METALFTVDHLTKKINDMEPENIHGPQMALTTWVTLILMRKAVKDFWFFRTKIKNKVDTMVLSSTE